MTAKTGNTDVDVVVVGAGFAGLYLLYRLRAMGFATTVLETADDVGGTWYWNRYPGARCDIPSLNYAYSFDPELDEQWQWTEKYATQPEILRYLRHVADKHDLRRDIQFSTRLAAATWDESQTLWRLRTDGGQTITCKSFVMATGCLSVPKDLDIAGVERFGGDVYFTGRWPHEGVDFTGMRVAVIGTGSSGIQSIPLLARQAAQLTVFQRTPNFSIPAHNGAIPEQLRQDLATDRTGYREAARWSFGGVPAKMSEVGALSATEAQRDAAYEEVWRTGTITAMLTVYNDLLLHEPANATMADFIRAKIRSIVKDPATAEMLSPRTFPFGTKRPCLDTDYYDTFNLPHVRLIDLRTQPISTITATGIEAGGKLLEFDVIVFATGFDALTGAIQAVDIRGRDGLSLREKWAHGPKTYLGLSTAGFPNFFMVTGPGSPSVLSNMIVSIEQHVEWISSCLEQLRRDGFDTIEPTRTAEDGWVQHVNDFADITLYPKANSWYMGANIPGKPRVFLPYVAGVHVYRGVCDEVVQRDYLGFKRLGHGKIRLNDGIVRKVQPDVAIMLEMIAAQGGPPLETLSVEAVREFSVAVTAGRPPGPDVGEIIDATLAGVEGTLQYRLYRPTTKGPHPIVVYFHGGGWVFGSLDSDDPLCRDLCVRLNAVLVSVNYRHAPEARFPAAADDGFAALKWVASHAAELGGAPGQLAVAGWSAGGNVAAVTAQMARDQGGPALCGQLLLTPVTDSDLTRSSYIENANGYVLTTPVMQWFWDHYADPMVRRSPKAAPLRAQDLSGLPPAVIVTCEFDPLRDEGKAYAEALAAAGVKVRHIPARGHVHTSLTLVDAIKSGAPVRAEMAAAFRELITAPARADREALDAAAVA
jgi:cation diffusion facilitator CzcD-associated flavoprotein CzcO/acetyl esterase/lipase